jgi:hypothetical protein
MRAFRTVIGNHRRPWAEAEEQKLTELLAQGRSGPSIGAALRRTQPAIDVSAVHEEMPTLQRYRLELPVGSTYAAGAEVFTATLADQTSMTWPEEFPHKLKRTDKADP